MSGTELTAEEREVLASIGAARGAPLQELAVWGLADLLREDFPGVDDVTLARVTLTLAVVGKTFADICPVASADEVLGLLARLAWVLAEVELETSP